MTRRFAAVLLLVVACAAAAGAVAPAAVSAVRDLADDAAVSKASGIRQPPRAPKSIADGLLTSLGEYTWPVVRDLVERVVLVEEHEIVDAMRLVFERMKQVIETSAAVPLAAVLRPEFLETVDARRVALVLCGGNADLDRLPWRTPTA
jgi:threonine dehydratase